MSAATMTHYHPDQFLLNDYVAGSLPGAVLAGFLLGAASVVMQVTLPVEARPFRDAFVYGAVIVMLLWRPQGLLPSGGGKERV